ncbi:MAG: NAD(P)H-hydrate dehydratase [Deltaproteobacteria bacterium]|nr:NAD(P)H-hydrate dehydratase [Deltaproteobacteria bacterium]
MRAQDAAAIQKGIPEVVLMEHAALGLVCALEERFAGILPSCRGIVLAGPGNNGGDALAVARILWLKGVRNFEVVLTGESASNLAKKHLAVLLTLKVPIAKQLPDSVDWIVDGIYGTGLSKPPEGVARRCIEWANTMTPRPWVVCADIPSGLDGDTGQPVGLAIDGSMTVTFGFLKRGLVTARAANYVGQLRLDPIQIPRDGGEFSTFLFEAGDIALPRRPEASHKGTFGSVKFWCGEKPGAALLAAGAAMRTGVGLVAVVGEEKALAQVEDRINPEILVEQWNGAVGAAAMGVGPGMGVHEFDRLEELLEKTVALVLDADATTIIAGDPQRFIPLIKERRSITVMTPHPKEAGRLLGEMDVEMDRFAAVKKLSDTFGCPVLLKGKGTLVACPEEPTVVVWEGNPALARGGAGDLLTGIVAGFLAQGMGGREALILGAHLEGAAALEVTRRRGASRTPSISEISDALATVIDGYR